VEPAWQVFAPIERVVVAERSLTIPDVLCRVLMMHKPSDTVTVNEKDVLGRPTVLDLVPEELRGGRLGIYGRLDADTTGLLLLGTDGGLGQLLHHPSHRIEKQYLAHLKHRPGTNAINPDVLQSFAKGVELAKGQRCAPARAQVLRCPVEQEGGHHERESGGCTSDGQREATGKSEIDSAWGLRLWITEGMHHQVKKMVAVCGGHVQKLHREAIGALQLDPKLEAGGCRPLTMEELRVLHQMLPEQRLPTNKKRPREEAAAKTDF